MKCGIEDLGARERCELGPGPGLVLASYFVYDICRKGRGGESGRVDFGKPDRVVRVAFVNEMKGPRNCQGGSGRLRPGLGDQDLDGTRVHFYINKYVLKNRI